MCWKVTDLCTNKARRRLPPVLRSCLKVVLILLVAFAVILCFLDGCNVNLRLLHVGKELFMLDVDTIDIYL